MAGNKVDFSQNFGGDDVAVAISSDDDDVTEAGNDAMLGGLRKCLRSIRSHAKTELAKCGSEGSRKDLTKRLESSTLRLIQAEQMFLETSRIVTGVVDDLVEDAGVISSDEVDVDVNGNSQTKITVSRFRANHNDDKLKPKLPNYDEILMAQAKMNELFDYRMQNYAETLTKENLVEHPQYVAFQTEVSRCEEYFHTNKDVNLEVEIPEEEKVYPAEDLDDDDDVLPSIDPISKKPIFNAHRNKFCNHIFDRTSIFKFIEGNPAAPCPMYLCQNTRPLQKKHFVSESKLTEKIRAKNSNNC